MPSNTERLPRFIRHRFRKPALVLQERDREIIRIVEEHRVITSADLMLLVAGSDQTILRRLQRLFHNGYLDRPQSQRQFGNAPIVYALGQRGAELLAQEKNAQATVDWSEKNRQIGSAYLEHALMVSRFRAALRFALQRGQSAALERWLGDGFVRDSVVVEHEASTERIPVAPDAFFTIKLLDEPEGRNRIHVFLEADRSTMTVKRFFTKLRGYWFWWRSGRQDSLGIKSFRVLTITQTTERAANLVAAARTIDAPRHRGLAMFLFGTERTYTDKPERVLEPLWRTPADDVGHSLME
jgi:hypothetical protein